MSPSKNSTKVFKLNTGATIPAIGFGTWQSFDTQAYEAVTEALKAGYRHIDTAALYRNEREVGRAIRDSGVPREDIFLTTKFWGTQHRDPAKALDQSLERLGLDYVDLFLVHWPVPLEAEGLTTEEELLSHKVQRSVDKDWSFIKTWELVQELPKTGKAKAVGVSNFSINNLKDLFNNPSTSKVVPAVNQVELHPLLPQTELIEFGNKHGIITEAYSPLGQANSPYLKNETLKSIAESYDASVAQILINWGVARGYVVLPKSSNKERIIANLKEFDLKSSDVEKISDLIKVEGENRLVRPPWDFPLFE